MTQKNNASSSASYSPTSAPIGSSSTDTAKTNSGSEDSGATTQRDEAALALKSTVSEGAKDLTKEVKHIATDLVGEAKKTAEAQLSGGKDRAAQGLGDIAEALRHTGEQLRSQDKTAVTDYVARAADKVDEASGYLQNHSFGEIIDDVQNFARREPALFLGGAFALGLIGGRFLKSSRPAPTTTGRNSFSSGQQASSKGAPRQLGSSDKKGTSDKKGSDWQKGGTQKGTGSQAETRGDASYGSSEYGNASSKNSFDNAASNATAKGDGFKKSEGQNGSGVSTKTGSV